MGMVLSDENLMNKFRIMGYRQGNEIITIDRDLTDLFKLIKEIDSDYNVNKCFLTKNMLIKRVKQFLDNRFDLHDVNFIPDNVAKNIKSLLDVGVIDYIMLMDMLTQTSKVVSPYNIPINYTKCSYTNEKYFNNGVYFSYIDIEKNMYRMRETIYVHELAHIQLDSQRGVIEDYHNREVISIFLENVYVSEMDNMLKYLYKMMSDRYYDLLWCSQLIKRDDILDLRKLEACIYIVSTLKALSLFDKYVSSDNKSKEEIMLAIQNIFDGRNTVEDFLDKFNISLDINQNKKIIKQLLKK